MTTSPTPLDTSCFRMLPRIRLSGEPPQMPTSEGRSSDARMEEAEGKRAVLVVEDEGDALEAILELLRGEGFTAVGAVNGQDALSLLNAGLKPALALVDLKMPVMSGWELCAVLSGEERFRGIPVTIVTASESPLPLPDRWKDAGFFAKPIDYDRLLRVVRQFCG
jgi:two-component system, chemotaxis family, chemotaxis protein CheY